ncbi:MAG: HAMP domain-containing histidine kinase [Sphingobacteriales bacterium]|nr:HAMP domain-containing histidine kinase [Sphingobacteriales bacterium]
MANRITNSFKLIGAKMREISLSKINEPIVWEREDEINDLVKEYNKMVDKLQESAGAIAKNERDEAWREMARQVAHEIKNPLTPMKLNLQYLQKAINEGRTDIHQLASNVSGTMVEQIDHLSRIASDFSQFSNINKPEKTKFDLHEVLDPLIEIHGRNPKIRTEWIRLPNSINIFADKTQMNRLFSNLLVNALEACVDKEGSKIIITEQIANKHITICVQDNGPGIDEKMKSKIFYPNFTTKSSGTGLGLAMCKNIVEQNGGSIWFETNIEKGAAFFVNLPSTDL